MAPNVFWMPASPPPPSASRGRPTRLIPTELVSTRTRSRNAAATGVSRPPVNYGFAPGNTSAAAGSACRRAGASSKSTGGAPTARPWSSGWPQADGAASSVEPTNCPTDTHRCDRASAGFRSRTRRPFGRRDGSVGRRNKLSRCRWQFHAWAREQQLEFECNACIRYVLLDRLDTPPPRFFRRRAEPSADAIFGNQGVGRQRSRA